MSEENVADNPSLEPILEAPEEKIEAPKKRRGRPPNSERLNETKIDSSGPSKQRKKKVEYDNSSIASLAQQIMGLHLIAAKMSGMSEMALSQIEAEMLATSVIGVAAEYDLSMSGKTGALLQLTGVAVMIYLPRFDLLNKRMRKEKIINPQPNSGI